MPKRNKTARAAAAAPPRHNSSDSENSDIEDRSHSRTSTSSVEEDHVKEQNGHAHISTTQKDSSVSFISRVSSIPLIHDSVTTLHSYAKDNKYGRYALDTAGSAVETVNKYTEGYQSRLQPHLQPHIAKVDQLATKSLDLIEGTFPIVTKPTSEIVTQVKKPIVYVEESSKNAYTQIQSTIDTRVTAPVKSVTSSIASTASSTVNSITSTAVSTRDQITTAATSTANNITTAATSTATNIATKVNTHATPLVDGLETIVNRYLPSDAEFEKTSVVQTNQATRVVDIGRSVSLRVTRRVSVAVAPVTKSANDLRTAAEKNTVVVKSKDQLNALNTRLTALLESLRVHSKELQENVQKAPREASSKVQLRVSELSTKVLSEIDSLSSYLKEHSPALPEFVQVRLQPLVSFVNDRYVVMKGELSKKDVSAVQKARNILHMTTEETLPILQNAAQDIRESLTNYQVKAQESVHKGLIKVQDVNSSVHLAAARVYHSARVILVGK
ncbi:hypothetical protein BC939DRAFT_462461 [Gamsiella multidivaricata]|uniref:uncharacterized protein n=1 Tax=Gamsiella multidivaricata TaxID=101098 RepID=UPI00221E5643|nr:uncharacterized protein BC939DRAFT_462461 [Gamsiella multidivaricata]KAG0364987.1 hypothetical protein BGZ54_006969 [Gamsiella multidivaricata]KAI7818671.1 hypothetical protein BC939DRAFT_462461 [Gamsiella multidivaricata]